MAKRAALALATVTLFVENLFYTAIIPLLPDLATRYDLSKAGVGILLGAYSAGVIVGSLPGALLASRFGFRRLAGLGIGVLAVATGLFAVGSNILVLDGARFVQGVGGGLAWIGARGWISAVAPPDRRGETMGWTMSFGVAGSMLGPVIGGLAVASSPQLVFLLLGLTQLPLAALVIAVRHEGEISSHAASHRRQGLRLSPAVRWAIALIAFPAMLSGLYEVLTPLHLAELGAGAGMITATFVLAALAQGVSSPLVGRFSDRTGRLLPLRVGLTVAPALCLILALSTSLGVLIPIAIASWVAIASSFTPAMAMVGDLTADNHDEASGSWAMYNVILNVGILLGSTGGAALAEASSDTIPYLLVGSGCLWVAWRRGWWRRI